jgi:small subunit ribosomal protein S6
MRTYQLVLVLKTSLTDANRKKFVETVKDWIKDSKFTKEEEWGEKVFAYPIKKEKSGFFLNFVFETKEDLIKDLEKKILASDNVLRQLLLKQ